MGGYRQLHHMWFNRYVMGMWAGGFICNWMSDQWYDIPRDRNANVRWQYWMDICNAKRAGEIDPTMPGYMAMKWINDREKIAWENHAREYPGFEMPDS